MNNIDQSPFNYSLQNYYKIIQLEALIIQFMDEPQWKGSRPQRFSGGKIHLRPQDEFGLSLQLRTHNQSPLGIKTYTPKPTPEQLFKPHQRIYDERYNSVTKQIDLRGKKIMQLPEQKERIRPERLHLSGGNQTYDEIKLKGIKSFEQSNQTRDKHYYVEERMQRKVKLYGLQSLRNNLAVSSLGDKAYKYPEYAPDFYKEGGLIPGATHKPRATQIITEIKPGTILTRPNWDVRVKMQELQQQKKLLDSIENWEQTTLKENNPNWKDPQTFFQRLEAEGAKDSKKAGKK